MSEIRMDYDYSRDRRLNNLPSLFDRKPKKPYLTELVAITDIEGWENVPALVKKVKFLRSELWKGTVQGKKRNNVFRIYTITDSEGNSFKTHSTTLLGLILNRHDSYISNEVQLRGRYRLNGYTVTGEVIEGGRVHIRKNEIDEAVEVFHEGGLKLLHERYTELSLCTRSRKEIDSRTDV